MTNFCTGTAFVLASLFGAFLRDTTLTTLDKKNLLDTRYAHISRLPTLFLVKSGLKPRRMHSDFNSSVLVWIRIILIRIHKIPWYCTSDKTSLKLNSLWQQTQGCGGKICTKNSRKNEWKFYEILLNRHKAVFTTFKSPTPQFCKALSGLSVSGSGFRNTNEWIRIRKKWMRIPIPEQNPTGFRLCKITGTDRYLLVNNRLTWMPRGTANLWMTGRREYVANMGASSVSV